LGSKKNLLTYILSLNKTKFHKMQNKYLIEELFFSRRLPQLSILSNKKKLEACYHMFQVSYQLSSYPQLANKKSTKE